MNTLSEIADVLRRLKSAVIFTHMRPDGDALGSAMALHRALFMLNIRSEVVNEGDIPEKFLFLEGMNSIRRAPTIDAEAYICVDSSDEARLGYAQAAFAAGAKKGKVTVNIDHHISNTRFCKYNFVRLRASNCENIAELIALMGVKPDKLLASYLLTGMVTATSTAIPSVRRQPPPTRAQTWAPSPMKCSKNSPRRARSCMRRSSPSCATILTTAL